MSIKKQYLKSKPVCKVTFALDKETAEGADKVTVAGDFNDWDKDQDELNKLKNGNFKTTLELPTDRSYQFRYLLNGEKWTNDPDADEQRPNEFNSENSVLSL